MNNNGVSEIIGMILLLLIAVAMFIPLELTVNNHFVEAQNNFDRYPIARILYKNGVLYHVEGQSIHKGEYFRCFYNNSVHIFTVTDLTGKDLSDGMFSFGEKAKVKI